MSQNLSSAAVVIGALRVNSNRIDCACLSDIDCPTFIIWTVFLFCVVCEAWSTRGGHDSLGVGVVRASSGNYF